MYLAPAAAATRVPGADCRAAPRGVWGGAPVVGERLADRDAGGCGGAAPSVCSATTMSRRAARRAGGSPSRLLAQSSPIRPPASVTASRGAMPWSRLARSGVGGAADERPAATSRNASASTTQRNEASRVPRATRIASSRVRWPAAIVRIAYSPPIVSTRVTGARVPASEGGRPPAGERAVDLVAQRAGVPLAGRGPAVAISSVTWLTAHFKVQGGRQADATENPADLQPHGGGARTREGVAARAG